MRAVDEPKQPQRVIETWSRIQQSVINEAALIRACEIELTRVSKPNANTLNIWYDVSCRNYQLVFEQLDICCISQGRVEHPSGEVGNYVICCKLYRYQHAKLIKIKQSYCRNKHGAIFLSRVSILLLTRDIDIVILSVRPSVRMSVTRWYCTKTA